MIKYITTLLSCFLLCMAGTQAQTLYVTGTITNGGIPAPNQLVEIYGTAGFSYADSAMTDANGVYVDSLIPNTTQGGIEIQVRGCTGMMETATGFFNPGMNTLNLDVDICPSGTGSCDANFSFTPQGLNVWFTDGSVASNPMSSLTWDWDFGDGNGSAMQDPIHTYSQAGTYTVCLWITDASGCVDSACTTVIVTSGNTCIPDFTYALSGTTVDFFDQSFTTSTGITTWLWDFGDGNTSTLEDPTHTYAVAGNYNVCLSITDAAGCSSVSCDMIQMNAGGGGCQSHFTYNQTSQTLTVSFNDGSVASVPGTSPIAWDWDFGDGTTAIVQNPGPHIFPDTGNYNVCLTITDATGCVDTYCRNVYVNPPQMFLGGRIFTSPATIAMDGWVYAIKYDSVAQTLTANDSTPILQGSYFFYSISAGDYLIKAALSPNDSLYADFLPTYYGDVLFWNQGSTVTLDINNPSNQNADINMIAGNNPGGPGFIGGFITQGANKTVGDPLNNHSIIVTDINDQAVMHTLTDSMGYYQLPNLAYGTYKIYVEVIGKDCDPQIVTISPASSMIYNVDFEVHSSYIAATVTSIEDVDFASDLNVYPNPMQDELQLELEMTQAEELNISLRNALGQLVYSQANTVGIGSQHIQIPTANLPQGMYFLNIQAGKQRITMKVLKQ